ncbi:MAG: DUF2314 domain-containing protein [Acidobacteriota bacterium]
MSSLHPLSDRQAVLEDDGTVAYLYLLGPETETGNGQFEGARLCWVYNRVAAPEQSELEKYVPNPLPAAIGFTASEPRREPPALAEIQFRWAKDGESVALLLGGEVVAYISARVSEERRQTNERSWKVMHGSVSRGLTEAGLWGVPWSDEDYREVFADAEAPHQASVMPDGESDDAPAAGGKAASIFGTENDDEAMDAAMEQARETFDFFVEQLRAAGPDQRDFFVKVGLREGDLIEHLWVAELQAVGDAVEGTLQNQPYALQGYAQGQRVTVERDDLSDWSYVENDKLRGGFTLRLLRERMSPEDRAAFDAGHDYEID